jgi:hypothetical protein
VNICKFDSIPYFPENTWDIVFYSFCKTQKHLLICVSYFSENTNTCIFGLFFDK